MKHFSLKESRLIFRQKGPSENPETEQQATNQQEQADTQDEWASNMSGATEKKAEEQSQALKKQLDSPSDAQEAQDPVKQEYGEAHDEWIEYSNEASEHNAAKLALALRVELIKAEDIQKEKGITIKAINTAEGKTRVEELKTKIEWAVRKSGQELMGRDMNRRYKPEHNPFTGVAFETSDEDMKEIEGDINAVENMMDPETVEQLEQFTDKAIEHYLIQPEDIFKSTWKKYSAKIAGKYIPHITAVGMCGVKMAVARKFRDNPRAFQAGCMMLLGKLEDMQKEGKVQLDDSGMKDELKNETILSLAQRVKTGTSTNFMHANNFLYGDANLVDDPVALREKEREDFHGRSVAIPGTDYRVGAEYSLADIKLYEEVSKKEKDTLVATQDPVKSTEVFIKALLKEGTFNLKETEA